MIRIASDKKASTIHTKLMISKSVIEVPECTEQRLSGTVVLVKRRRKRKFCVWGEVSQQ